MTPQEIRDVIRQEHAVHAAAAEQRMRDVVSTTVRETLLQIGISQTDPIELQKDFAHLRKWRMAVDGAASKAALTVMGILVTGVLGAMWIGFKVVIKVTG